MVNLNFLKSIFKKEAPAESAEVKLDDLEAWLKSRASSKIGSSDDELKEVFGKIKEEKEKLNSSLETLKNAELRNKNIPVRELQIMEGNRSTYINKVKAFAESISLPDNNHENCRKFCESFNKQLNELNSSTGKGYFVLQHFFANESREVALNIKNMDNYVKDITSIIEGTGIVTINSAVAGIQELNNKLKQKKEIDERITQEKKAVEELSFDLDKLGRKINAFQKSQEFVDYTEHVQLKDEVAKEINAAEDEVNQLFSGLSRALAKFKRMSPDENLINKYLEDPAKTIAFDKEMKILKIIEQLKKNIDDDILDLKDRKKEKTLEIANKLTRQFIESYCKKYEELKHKKSQIEQKIYSNKATQEYSEMENKLEFLNSRIKRISLDIEILDKKKEKINIEELKNKVALELKSCTNVNVKII